MFPRSRLVSFLVPALLGFLPSLRAQTPKFFVSPADLEKREGPGGDDYPFALPVIRYQQVHDDLTRRALLEELAFRRDGLRGTSMTSWSAEMEVWLSTSKVTARTLTTTFAANRGNDHTLVLPRSWIHFPDLPRPKTPPASFLARIPFKHPFPFRAAGSLLWEVAVHGNRQGNRSNLRVFSFLDAQAPVLAKGPHASFGKGCKGSKGQVPLLDAWLRNDGFFRAMLSGVLPYARGFLIFGKSDKTFFTYKLPLDLGPMGAPRCSLFTDVLSLHPVTAGGLGTALYQLGKVPITGEMEGLSILLQAVSLDARANPLGAVFSNAVRMTVPKVQGNTGVSRLYSLGDLKASQGIRDLGYGLVTRFRAK